MNIRGDDVPYNPFVYSWLLVDNNRVHFFIKNERITQELRNHLLEAEVIFHEYRDIYPFVRD